MKIKSTGPSKRKSATNAISPAAAAKAYSEAAAPRTITDTLSIMGIPEAELTPKVRQAIMTLMQEVDTLRRSIETIISRLDDAEKRADQDPLLPIYNRRAFIRELIRVQASTERYKTDASLAYIDLDNFKSVNDTYGHQAGDHVLLEFSKRLLAGVRETDIVGRLGGDEFGLILSRTHQDDVAILLNRISQELRENPISWDGKPLQVGLSYGIVAIESGRDVRDTMEIADGKMYQQKKNVKNI